MRKLFFCIAFAVAGFAVNAQDLKFGANVGLPLGDAGDAYTFNLALDVSYLWNVGEGFDAGIASGYSHSFGDSETILGVKFSVPDFSFIPIAGAARYLITEDFRVGVDLGYAINVSKDGDGGFYYAPRLQYAIKDNLDIVASYRGVSVNGGSFDTVALGLEFRL